MYQRKNICLPTMCPTAPTSPTELPSSQLKSFVLALNLLEVISVGAVGAEGHTVGIHKLFLWYIDHPWYPI